MKKLFLTMVIAIVTATSMSAQDNSKQQITAQQRIEQYIKKMDEKLTLTEEQKTEIRKLYADFNKQKYLHGKRKEAMEKLTADITLVLIPDQQVIYEQMVKEAASKRKDAKRNNSAK